MGLIDRWWAFAFARPHVLLVAAPGTPSLTYQVRSELRQRGWREALAPAGADVLIVVGRSDDAWRQTVATVWDSLPGPRLRLDIEDLAGVRVLDQVVPTLSDVRRGRAEQVARPAVMPGAGPAMAGHMTMPGGLPEAGREPDRDGLTLDVLHVSLGPVLVDWPAGLELRVALQGDVVQQAELHWFPAAETDAPPLASPAVVARLDQAAAVVRLAGDSRHARVLEGLRDDLAEGGSLARASAQAQSALRGATALRWSLRGVGRSDGLDVWDRLCALVSGEPVPELADAGELVGVELAELRLVVASLMPLDRPAQRPAVLPRA